MKDTAGILMVKGEKRADREIRRRTNFLYLGGRGTVYRFARKHPPYQLLAAEKGQLVSTVLYNMNTRQLDEVAFMLCSRSDLGNSIKFNGIVECDGEGYFTINIYYYKRRRARNPNKGTILVEASAPYYNIT